MAATLTAWTIRSYGAPDRLAPVQRPMPTPGPTEILIRIRASAVTRADGMMRAGRPRFARAFLGFRRPRKDLSGTGLSGEVIAVGAQVRRFAVGDAVFGEAGLNFGANASHICLDENGVLMHKPAALSHEDAAVMCDGPLTSLNFLQNVARLVPGERVLILGGSGSLGSAAVQIAAAMGADVTASCSTRNVELVASLGADRVIDYTKQDPLAAPDRYDVIYDTLGITTFRKARQSLAQNGRYVCPVLSLGLLLAMLRTSAFGQRKARFSATGLLKPEILRPMLAKLIKMNTLGKLEPVIERVYPLDDLIAAHEHMESGHKRGNIVVV
ncbi:NAD(P)-dependent alcohol dehydrogenase [Phaeovulum sp.]|uniref:NAD(P)-dependent alcohol dehydrogenase n=1 Tax=Phaeovulum sp. TaxID=2934796 RepID=UPI00356392EF